MALRYSKPVGYPTALAEQERQDNVGPAQSTGSSHLDRATSVLSYQPLPLIPPRFPSLPPQRLPHSLPPPALQQSYTYNVPVPPQSYPPPSLPQQTYSLPSLPQQQSLPQKSYSLSTLQQQQPPAQQPYPYSAPQTQTSTFETPQPFPSVEEEQRLPYPDTTGTFQSYGSSNLGTVPALTANSYQPVVPYQTLDSHTTYAPPPERQPTSGVTRVSTSSPPVDNLARVLVQDGEVPQTFTSGKALESYLRIFTEADNDQGCRVFKYGPNCPTDLLMPLFEHFDFPRYSTFPYGFASDFSVADHWGAGSCKCTRCLEGQLCGHYVLHKNFHFYAYQDVTNVTAISPKVTSTSTDTIISVGNSQVRFTKADWNLQFFRFRSRRLQTTEFAFDALVYQNYEGETKLKSSPLDYVLAQLEVVLTNWDSLLDASLKFLSSFRVEILEERLETDRSIIRSLLLAAQHWEEFRKVLQIHMSRLEFLENVHGDPRWTEGRDDYYELLATASGYLQRFRAIDYRITSELMQETDSIVQRVTNLITIDEGYRSRDQNASIRRLTWITFIFLPMIFTAAIFSMQVDLFSQHLPWQFYIYTALVLMFIVFSGHALLRFRGRVVRLLKAIIGLLAHWLFEGFITALSGSAKGFRGARKNTTDLEGQLHPSFSDDPTILKWAASSGRTDVVRNILQASSKKTKLTPGMTGQALLLAIQNGHSEAANLLIDTGEGLFYTDSENATVLHWAAKMGQASICQRLLDKRVPLDAKDLDDQTALDWAIKGDDERTINILLKGGKNYTRQETANLQSLHFSARTGDIGMIKEFHKQGSSLEARDDKGQTVLFHAVKGKQHAVIEWLTGKGQANVQAVDKQGLTALHVAAQVSDVKSAEILLEHNANVNALSSHNLTPLHCIPHSEGARVLILLHEKGADINAFDKDKNRIVHKAASRGDSASLLFKVASDLGADLKVPGAQGNTPAHHAADSGSKIILGLLNQKEVDIQTVRNAAGYTPLMLAARAGKLEAMRFLLERGASYNVADSEGRSLIELSIHWGNPEVMSLLQEHGANYQHVTTAGSDMHPIWKAVHEGQGASVAKLLDGGVSVEYEHNGVRMLQLAIEVDNLDVVRLLLERGAAVDVPDMRGWTALHSAAWSGNIETMLLVLQKTENKEPKDQQGWSPLDLAAFYKHHGITKLLDPEDKVKEFAWAKAGRVRINATSYYRPPIVQSVISGVAEAS